MSTSRDPANNGKGWQKNLETSLPLVRSLPLSSVRHRAGVLKSNRCRISAVVWGSFYSFARSSFGHQTHVLRLVVHEMGLDVDLLPLLRHYHRKNVHKMLFSLMFDSSMYVTR